MRTALDRVLASPWANVLEQRSSTSLVDNFLYQLLACSGNSSTRWISHIEYRYCDIWSCNITQCTRNSSILENLIFATPNLSESLSPPYDLWKQ